MAFFVQRKQAAGTRNVLNMPSDFEGPILKEGTAYCFAYSRTKNHSQRTVAEESQF